MNKNKILFFVKDMIVDVKRIAGITNGFQHSGSLSWDQNTRQDYYLFKNKATIVQKKEWFAAKWDTQMISRNLGDKQMIYKSVFV